jgi:hypothetical protein
MDYLEPARAGTLGRPIRRLDTPGVPTFFLCNLQKESYVTADVKNAPGHHVPLKLRQITTKGMNPTDALLLVALIYHLFISVDDL